MRPLQQANPRVLLLPVAFVAFVLICPLAEAYSLLRPGGILGKFVTPPRLLRSPAIFDSAWSAQRNSRRRPHNPKRFLGSSPGNDSSEENEPPRGKNGFIPPIFAKDEEEAIFIKSTLLTNFMFQSLPDKTLKKLVSAFEKVEFKKKSVIIRQGDSDIDYFYVLQSGECSVTIDGKQLPDPYGTLSEGTVFGELAMLYNVPRAATVSAGTEDCTLYRVDKGTFKYFIDSQQPREREGVKAELRRIDNAIDKIAGVKTRYSGSIIRQYRPNRLWLWKRWSGTVLQHAYKGALFNMAITASLCFLVGRRADSSWAIGMAPDSNHPIISRLLTFGKSWKYMISLTTFILTFFLSQAYSLWREVYNMARAIQGRLNDVNLLLSTHAERDERGEFTPAAEKILKDIASYSRLFHAFNWANYASAFNVLLSPRGMSRMLSRGLMTQGEFNALQAIGQEVGAHNACLEWIVVRALRGTEEGSIMESESMVHVLLGKICALRGTYAGIADVLDGRMPLAYAHFVQILVDCFLGSAPFALYPELGIWAILSVGILTLFYSGLLDLAKIFLDPLDNDDFFNESVNCDIGVLIREGNAGSTRWKDGAAIFPF